MARKQTMTSSEMSLSGEEDFEYSRNFVGTLTENDANNLFAELAEKDNHDEKKAEVAKLAKANKRSAPRKNDDSGNSETPNGRHSRAPRKNDDSGNSETPNGRHGRAPRKNDDLDDVMDESKDDDLSVKMPNRYNRGNYRTKSKHHIAEYMRQDPSKENIDNTLFEDINPELIDNVAKYFEKQSKKKGVDWHALCSQITSKEINSNAAYDVFKTMNDAKVLTLTLAIMAEDELLSEFFIWISACIIPVIVRVLESNDGKFKKNLIEGLKLFINSKKKLECQTIRFICKHLKDKMFELNIWN